MLEAPLIVNSEHFTSPTMATSAYRKPPGSRKPFITPEEAENKAHRTLAALDGLQPGQGLSVSEIAEHTGLSRRDLGRILSRLSRARRISRNKEADGPDAYFRYWMDNEQRKRFHAQVRGFKANGASGRLMPSFGDTTLDALIELGVKRLTARNEIERERARLQARVDTLQSEIEAGRREVTKLKSQIRDKERAVRKIKQDIQAQRDKAGQASLHHDNALVTAQSAPTELSARLAFIRRLRARPALADMVDLKKIELDYERALRVATNED